MSNLFDEEQNKKDKIAISRRIFQTQDNMANQSEVFNRILQSEIDDNPDIRLKQTDSPQSKTRNALISRYCYKTKDGEFDQETWERYLLKNQFYGLCD